MKPKYDLRNATRIHSGRTSVKRAYYNGKISANKLFDHPTMQKDLVYRVVMAQKGLGMTRARKILKKAEIYPILYLRELSPRQKELLIDLMNEKGYYDY